MLQLNAEQSARKLLEHCACDFYAIFFAQSNSFLLNLITPGASRPRAAGLPFMLFETN
jgi:hypothetical protein